MFKGKRALKFDIRINTKRGNIWAGYFQRVDANGDDIAAPKLDVPAAVIKSVNQDKAGSDVSDAVTAVSKVNSKVVVASPPSKVVKVTVERAQTVLHLGHD